MPKALETVELGLQKGKSALEPTECAPRLGPQIQGTASPTPLTWPGSYLAWCLLQGVQREDPHSPHSPSSCGSQGLSLAFWRLKQPLSAPPPGLGPLQALRASWALGMAVQSRNDSGPARMPSSVPGTGQYSEKCDSGPR